MPDRPLFRQQALASTLAPDEVDRLGRVVDPKGWIALVAVVLLMAPVVVWGFVGRLPTEVRADEGILVHRDALHGVVAPVTGIITEVRIATGDPVTAEMQVATIRTEDGRTVPVMTLHAGTAVDVPVDRGMLMERGQQVAVVEEGDEPLGASFFVPAEDGKALRPGMQVLVSPSTAPVEKYGFLRGQVVAVSQFPVTKGDMFKLLQDQSLVDALRVGNSQLEVDVALTPDPATPTGFAWTASAGPPSPLQHGTPCTASFVLGEQRPVDLFRRADPVP